METGVEDMDLTFSTTVDNYGMEVIADLVPEGRSLKVTAENKQAFVEAYVRWFLTDSIKTQFDPFLKGFYKVVSIESIQVSSLHQLLSSAEVIKLVCGVDELNMKELERSTEYENATAEDPTIVWLWEIVHSFDEEQKKKFIKFVTGSDRSPLRGLSDLRFVVMVQAVDDNRLPSAHTCFNHLILSAFTSKEKLQAKLLQAIEHHEGFGLS
jgi:ubiquitin-protein ligase E3 A